MANPFHRTHSNTVEGSVVEFASAMLRGFLPDSSDSKGMGYHACWLKPDGTIVHCNSHSELFGSYAEAFKQDYVRLVVRDANLPFGQESGIDFDAGRYYKNTLTITAKQAQTIARLFCALGNNEGYAECVGRFDRYTITSTLAALQSGVNIEV